jgi:ABC-type nitrate/sulfonate/bicarbonate transport system substrate-binding protein
MPDPIRTPSSARRLARLAAASLGALSLIALAGCSADAEPDPQRSGGAISAERCAENEAAGTIDYVTGFGFQASASILDVVAAEGLGYFEDLCLDVDIQAGTGNTAANAQLVAAGTATMTDLGSDSDLLRALANGVEVTAVATLGHVPIETLMTGTDITDLTQLDGTTLGHKGQLPATLQAMLLDAGVDLDSVTQVQVGYDPSVLPRGQVQSLTGYKSNEPDLLRAAGDEVTLWNPEDYGIPGTFGTTVVNDDFASDHPTAVEDMLRAASHAFDYCIDAAAECVQFAADKSEAGYDVDHNIEVWNTEQALVTSTTPEGAPLGVIDTGILAQEVAFLTESDQIPADLDYADAFDPSYLEAIYDGTELIWPAP